MGNRRGKTGRNTQVQQLERQIKILSEQLEDKEWTASKLSRSSVEAYGGLTVGIVLAVFRMTWWLRIPFLVFLICLSFDFCWRSPFTYRWAKLTKGLLCTAVICFIVWEGRSNVVQAYQDDEFPPDTVYLIKWGPADLNGVKITSLTPLTFQGITANDVVVDGDALRRFADRYRVVAICLHYHGLVDQADQTGISKSSAFDIINGPISIRIPWNSQYKNEIAAGEHGTVYAVLLVPKTLEPDEFDSVREALKRGAHGVRWAGGAAP